MAKVKQSLPVITITDADDDLTMTPRYMDVEGTMQHSNGQLHLKHQRVRKWPVARACIDVLLLVFTWFGVGNIIRSFGPYQQGFFCEDSTIRLPYRPNTVTVRMLFTYCLGLVPVVILLTECYRLFYSASMEIYSAYEHGRHVLLRLFIRFFIFEFFFMLALVSTEIATTVTKYSVGRLRPHFLDVCRPNISLADCRLFGGEYITSFECHNWDVHKAQDARLSFWSGHSALSICAATFALLYLQSRLKGQVQSLVVVPFLQLALFSSALYICYTRISDHMHHPTDVLVGITMGALISSLVVFFVAELEMFSCTKNTEKFAISPGNNILNIKVSGHSTPHIPTVIQPTNGAPGQE